MQRLTALQTRCLNAIQKLLKRNKESGCVQAGRIANKIGKTGRQTSDCLKRLRNKGLVLSVDRGYWGLTTEGNQYDTEES